jgi:malonyl CoA-acyl carrier protein transacylase
MGEGLFDKYPKLTAIADKILGYSIKDLCLNDSAQNLSQTQYTQPALYVVNALTYQDQVVDKGLQPSFLAGHSLGEFNALYAAKVFDFETGLRIVQKRGAIMSTISGGGMAAVIGLSEEKVRELLSGLLGKKIDIANINSSKQIVISGLQKDVLASEQSFLDAGAQMFIRLNVSGAFP